MTERYHDVTLDWWCLVANKIWIIWLVLRRPRLHTGAKADLMVLVAAEAGCCVSRGVNTQRICGSNDACNECNEMWKW